MNDRYLFKAKRIDNGEWIFGNLLTIAKFNYFICTGKIKLDGASKGYICPEMYAVDESTICQCTGLKDKNGTLIWENDIIRCGRPTFVSWNEKFASWCLTRKGWLYSHFFGEAQKPEDCEVIGNIFDNPELLEVK